jgi:hypothetical protein
LLYLTQDFVVREILFQLLDPASQDILGHRGSGPAFLWMTSCACQASNSQK